MVVEARVRLNVMNATLETNEKIYDVLLANNRLQVRDIVNATGISHASVGSILN